MPSPTVRILRPPPHLGPGFIFRRPRALGLALIVQFLAFRHRDFALDLALLQIDLGGNQRKALLARFAQQFIDLAAVQQQLAVADGRMVLAVAVRILADVGVHEPGLVVLNHGEGFFELDLAVLGGLDLGAGEYHAGLEALHQEIVVACLPVIAQDFDGGVFVSQDFGLHAPNPNSVNSFRWDETAELHLILT